MEKKKKKKSEQNNNRASGTDTGTSTNGLTTDKAIEEILKRETNIANLRNFLRQLHQGHYTRLAETRIAQLKNQEVNSGEVPMSRQDKELAKKVADARKALLPVPACVKRILNADYTYISNDHKKLIQDCVPWTIQALKHSYLDQEIKHQVRLLLGTFQFTQCLSWAQPSWPKLMSGLRSEMLSIGRELSDIYQQDGLRDILGTLNPPLLDNTNARQDCPSGLLTPPAFGKASAMLHYDHHTIDLEISYIHYVRLIAAAVNEMFKEEIMEIISDLLVGGQVFCGGIKGYERMQNKLKSFADHWNSAIPRSAENLDVNRCLAVFNTAEEIVKAVDRLISHYGSFVKFKNGMAWSDEEAEQSMHLRHTLDPVTGAKWTFGDLCRNPAVQKQWKMYSHPDNAFPVEEGVVGGGPWRRQISRALEWLHSPDIRHRTVTVVCEVQILLATYRDMRMRMHEMYKALRADNAIRLHTDFVKNQKQALADKELRQDRGEGDSTIFGIFKNHAHAGNAKFFKGKETEMQTLSKKQLAALISVASKYGNITTVKQLLTTIKASDQNVSAVLASFGEGYHFPLFNAAEGKNTAARVVIMKALLNAKAVVNQTTNGGCSSLWKAANAGFKNAVRILIDARADINASQENTTITPVYNACYRGHDEIAEMLIQAKGDVHQRRITTGATPLYTASENAHAPILWKLIKAKASVNEVTIKNHSSPLYIAAQNGHLEIIHILATNKANVHLSRKADGCTPFYAAADKGYCEILRYLLRMKSDVNKTTKDLAWCPLNIAAHRGFMDTVKTLIELKANMASIKSAISKAKDPEIKKYLKRVQYNQR